MPFSSPLIVYNPAFPLDGIDQTEGTLDENDESVYELCSQQSSSNDTASNLPGPGRTLGLLYSCLGRALERTIGRIAHQSGFGPKAVASKIKCIKFEGTWASGRNKPDKDGHIHRVVQWTVKVGSEAKLRCDCMRLAKYATAEVWETRFEALVQIIEVITGEPRLRTFFNTPSILLDLKSVTQSSYIFSHGSADREDDLMGHKREMYLAKQALLAIEDNPLNDVIKDFLRMLFTYKDSQKLVHSGYKDITTKLLAYCRNPRYSFIAEKLRIRVMELASDVAASLQTQFEQNRQTQGLDRAITLYRVILDLLPENCPYCCMSQSNHAASMATRCMHHGRMEGLEEESEMDRVALELRPEHHPDRSACLRNLSTALRKQYEHYGRIEDLEEAIELARADLELYPEGHPDRSISLYYLGISLALRHLQYGKMEDLREMIELTRAALELSPEGHRYCSTSLSSLADSLSIRYTLSGKIQNLEKMTKLIRVALELRSKGHLDSFTILVQLSAFLGMRYVQHIWIEDLEAAVMLNRATLQLSSQGHPDFSTSLIGLPTYLGIGMLYVLQHGGMEDVKRLIQLGRASIRHHLKEYPDCFTCITIFSTPLRNQYVWHRRMGDFKLEEAIGSECTALKLHTKGFLDCLMPLTVLSATLRQLHMLHHRGIGNLEEAIESVIKNSKLFSKGYCSHSVSLKSLAAFL